MVSKNLILKSLNDSLDNKCGPTIGEMHSFIDGLNDKEKNTLLKYSEVNMEEYNSLDSPDEKFEMEKSIFKNFYQKLNERIFLSIFQILMRRIMMRIKQECILFLVLVVLKD